MNSSTVKDSDFDVAWDADAPRGRMTKWDDIKAYVFAGNATFTLLSVSTQNRFTYKVRKPKDDEERTAKWGESFFVSLLRGPSNEDDFAYMGVIDKKGFHATNKSRMGPEAPSWKAFAYFLARMAAGGEPSTTMEFWHEGRCGRCGRKLTVPVSVARGIGPECAERMAA
jgi:hypothetical protein